MPGRSKDWLAPAVRDLEQAEDSRRNSKHEWTCFAAHQSAGKAVEALPLFLSPEAWGHVVSRLLGELADSVKFGDDLVDRARVLDAFYIPSRYPNAHPEGAPFEHYGALKSKEALNHANKILTFVRDEMALRRT